jgi:guanylate kinase
MLFIVSGPSGVGKSTLTRALLARQPRLTLSVSHTTRAPRGDEVAAIHYHFVDDPTFDGMLAAGAFAEHAHVFGQRYGTAKSTLERLWHDHKHPLLDIDYQGAAQLMASYPESAVTVLICPPSLSDLEARLRGRRTETEAQLQGRLAKARHELSQHATFEYVVVNDDLDRAVARLEAIYLAEQARTKRNQDFLSSLLGTAGKSSPGD